ncbi:MAG: hypothetical protein Q8P74_01280 [bacterium]|nr:hypothetical protein [bacterium]
MLIDVKARNLDGTKQKIQENVKAAICQLPGIKVNPEEIIFSFGQPQSHRIGDKEEIIKIMVILDPYPYLEEIDNLHSDMLKAAVKSAAEKAADRETMVSLRCSRSCVGNYCWE